VTGSTFVGSVAARKIVRVDSTGSVSDLSQPGELQHVLGLAVDSGRRRLHAVSTNALTEAGMASPVNEIVTYNLDSGKRERSVAVKGASQLNDVITTPGGDLYTTDTRPGAVYHIRVDGTVDTLVAPGTLPGANGLSLSPDGSGLYVAHGSGVALVDFGGGLVTPRLELPPGETIAAIDGLYTDGNTLIGIQNVTNPGRVIRMRLRKDGKGVEKVETLLSHHHEAIDEPTTGAIAGRTFVFLATTQMARFTPQGTIESPETVKPAVVLGVDLDREYE
jgi:sugar lactone lactonase YvrE